MSFVRSFIAMAHLQHTDSSLHFSLHSIHWHLLSFSLSYSPALKFYCSSSSPFLSLYLSRAAKRVHTERSFHIISYIIFWVRCVVLSSFSTSHELGSFFSSSLSLPLPFSRYVLSIPSLSCNSFEPFLEIVW